MVNLSAVLWSKEPGKQFQASNWVNPNSGKGCDEMVQARDVLCMAQGVQHLEFRTEDTWVSNQISSAVKLAQKCCVWL